MKIRKKVRIVSQKEFEKNHGNILNTWRRDNSKGVKVYELPFEKIITVEHFNEDLWSIMDDRYPYWKIPSYDFQEQEMDSEKISVLFDKILEEI